MSYIYRRLLGVFIWVLSCLLALDSWLLHLDSSTSLRGHRHVHLGFPALEAIEPT